jgi:hypothetical protein
MSTASPASSSRTAVAPQKPEEQPSCLSAQDRPAASGEIRCPVCYRTIPPEHIGYKIHCRRCGYLESCCNPI